MLEWAAEIYGPEKFGTYLLNMWHGRDRVGNPWGSGKDPGYGRTQSHVRVLPRARFTDGGPGAARDPWWRVQLARDL